MENSTKIKLIVCLVLLVLAFFIINKYGKWIALGAGALMAGKLMPPLFVNGSKAAQTAEKAAAAGEDVAAATTAEIATAGEAAATEAITAGEILAPAGESLLSVEAIGETIVALAPVGL